MSNAVLSIIATILTFSRYIPSGSSKFGAFTIENIDGESSLQYQLYVDGKEAWNTTLVAAKPASGTSGSIWDFLKF